MAPGRLPQVGDHPTTLSGGSATTTLAPPVSHNAILVAVANLFRQAAGDQEIASFGKCPLHPEYTLGAQGLL